MPRSSKKGAGERPTRRAPRRSPVAVETPGPVERLLTRAEVVAEADTWRGTPWQHQQSLKGVGADCLGFLRGIARFVGFSDLPFQDYCRVNDQSHEESGWKMIRLLDENLIRLPNKFAVSPGDWFALLDELTMLPQHVVMVRSVEVGPIFQVIHATQKHGVNVNRLDRRFLRRVHSAYRVPGVAD